MVGWQEFVISLVTVIVVFAVMMVLVMITIWMERRVAAFMQYRIGPNRAGPMGILQTLADGVKLFFKEGILPRNIDKVVYEIAPLLSIVPAFLAFAIVPFGPGFHIGSWFVNMQVASLNIGILWLLAMSSIGVYSAMLAGWSSGSKYPLLGGVRASAQVISYELVLSLSIVPVIVLAGTLNMQGIVEAQGVYRWFFIPLAIPTIFFYVAGIAETNRPPFDLVEAESELVGGFHTEYSGIRFALFFLAEYINMITFSAITVTLFFGGWNGPMPGVLPDALWGFIWFFLKTVVLVFLFMWIRVTLPRIRYDQLMRFGWKIMLPISIIYLLAVALAVGLVEQAGSDVIWFGS